MTSLVEFAEAITIDAEPNPESRYGDAPDPDGHGTGLRHILGPWRG
jgi:hypothetical protein